MLLSISNLSKQYIDAGFTTSVLKDVHLELDFNSSLSIIGPSGSGKTSLLQIIALIENFDSGSYKFNGKEVKNLSILQKQSIMRDEISIVYQQHNLLYDFSVCENIQIATHNKVDKNKILKTLEALDIVDCIDKRPAEISGGQAQRANIARAILRSPKLLLLDEPTGSLDSSSAENVMTLIQNLASSIGISFILVTHNTAITKYTKAIYSLKNGILKMEEC
jgi:putative ABC transport system ATP-binding protein